MIVTFDKEYLSELFYEGLCRSNRYRFQPDIIERYKRRIDTLHNSTSIEALYRIHSLRYEVLTCDKAGISEIRVNDQYRIEFTVSHDEHGEKQLTVCNITELSNHYK